LTRQGLGKDETSNNLLENVAYYKRLKLIEEIKVDGQILTGLQQSLGFSLEE